MCVSRFSDVLKRRIFEYFRNFARSEPSCDSYQRCRKVMLSSMYAAQQRRWCERCAHDDVLDSPPEQLHCPRATSRASAVYRLHYVHTCCNFCSNVIREFCYATKLRKRQRLDSISGVNLVRWCGRVRQNADAILSHMQRIYRTLRIFIVFAFVCEVFTISGNGTHFRLAHWISTRGWWRAILFTQALCMGSKQPRSYSVNVESDSHSPVVPVRHSWND